MNTDKDELNKGRREEWRLKKILLGGLAAGLVMGVVFTSLLNDVGGNKKEVVQVEPKKETIVKEKIEIQVIDAVEAARLNAESLTSETDEWKLTLVNEFYPLATDYKPELQEIERGMLVDKRIVEDLQKMLSDIRAAGLNPYICSAYRDYEYQRTVFNDTMVTWIAQGAAPLDAYDETAKSVAVPGTSEHATGLALDITSAEFAELDERQADTAEAKWFAENCWKYGFILRYPPDKSDITGIVYEPWHYRYVGKEAAKEITEKGVTLEEYLGKE